MGLNIALGIVLGFVLIVVLLVSAALLVRFRRVLLALAIVAAAGVAWGWEAAGVLFVLGALGFLVSRRMQEAREQTRAQEKERTEREAWKQECERSQRAQELAMREYQEAERLGLSLQEFRERKGTVGH